MKVALQNMKATLEAAGSSVANVVKATVFVVDLADFQVVNEEYKNGRNMNIFPTIYNITLFSPNSVHRKLPCSQLCPSS